MLINNLQNLVKTQSYWGALLTGALAVFSQPGYSFDWFVWSSLIPLFFLLAAPVPTKKAFMLGWLAGFAYFAILLYWLFALSDWAGPWIALGYLVLVSYLACYWGVFSALSAVLMRRLPVWGLCLALPSVWVLLEFVRSLTRFGFTWGYLSDALYARPELIQLSSLAGAWVVTFLIVLCNALLFLFLRERKVCYLIIVAMLIISNWGLGLMMMQETSNEKSLEIALIHSHVDQRDRSDPSQLDRLIELYTNQIEQLPKAKAQLVILPETILPAFLLRNDALFDRFAALAREKKAWLLLGAVDYKPMGPNGTFNTTALISPEGELVSEYDKVQLVPFSTEYFPLIGTLKEWEFLGNLLNRIPLGSLTPGAEFALMDSAIGKLATPICFESIFPAISRAFVQKGAQAIFVLTNDGWFKDGLALQQHFAKGVFRAVENRRYFAQTSNAGITGIVSSLGKIMASTGAKKETTLQGKVVLHEGWTLYTRYGDWFVYLCLVLTAFMLVFAFSKKRAQ